MASDISYPFLIGDLIVSNYSLLAQVVDYLPGNKISVMAVQKQFNGVVWIIDSSEFWQWTYTPENPNEKETEETLKTLIEQEEKHREQLLIQQAFLARDKHARRASVA